MISVVIDYLSIPLALRSIIKNLHFDMPSIMLISPGGISKRSENQSTDQDEHSSFVKGPFYESKTMNLNQNRRKVQNSSKNIEFKALEPIVGPRSRGPPGM